MRKKQTRIYEYMCHVLNNYIFTYIFVYCYVDLLCLPIPPLIEVSTFMNDSLRPKIPVCWSAHTPCRKPTNLHVTHLTTVVLLTCPQVIKDFNYEMHFHPYSVLQCMFIDKKSNTTYTAINICNTYHAMGKFGRRQTDDIFSYFS